MAKKKNSQFLPGFLEDIMSLLTPEEQEIAFELFNDGANQVDENCLIFIIIISVPIID